MYKIQEGTPPNGYTIKASYKNFLITAVFKGDKPRKWGNGTTNVKLAKNGGAGVRRGKASHLTTLLAKLPQI